MGLIAAFLLPLCAGIPSVQIDPFEWVLVPNLLLQAISMEKGTISWLPNFALNMMADKIRDEDLPGVRLDSWRLVVNCSEPVRQESVCRFRDRFGPYGLRAVALSSCYAMAETTFAVTQTPPRQGPAVLRVDRRFLSKGVVRPAGDGTEARVCVSSGRVIEGCRVIIVDDERAEVAAGVVGEIAIRSESMFDGYRNYPEKTSVVLQDGWYYSGDYGFISGDELFVIGRKKDIIVVAGNNIYPEDVEDAVGAVAGVIPGRVVAFAEDDSVAGTEQVAVIAEAQTADRGAQEALRLEIVKTAMAVDVSVRNVYLVPPRWLIKSSAGKPSRTINRDRILVNLVNDGDRDDRTGAEASDSAGAEPKGLGLR
jgi:acyl-CoA synthetase (AMP-forming)/AMP-acid ligase II